MAAVHQSPFALLAVRGDQTLDMCIEAVKQDIRLLGCVRPEFRDQVEAAVGISAVDAPHI